MNTSERLAQRRVKREKLVQRMSSDREALSQLDKDISMLEALEIKAMLQEVNLPFDEIKRLIQTMPSTPMAETEEVGDVT